MNVLHVIIVDSEEILTYDFAYSENHFASLVWLWIWKFSVSLSALIECIMGISKAVNMPPCLLFLFTNTKIRNLYVPCAASMCLLTIQTMISFMRRHFLAKGLISWYEFHSYAMFWFLTTIVILDVDYFIPVCRRNPDNAPCFGTTFASVRYDAVSPCDHLRSVRTSIIVLTWFWNGVIQARWSIRPASHPSMGSHVI